MSVPSFPLRFQDPARFHALREALQSAGYTEPALCSRLGIARLSELRAVGEGRDPEPLGSASSVLTHLLLDRESAPSDLVDRRLGSTLFSLLEEFGLLRPHPTEPGHILATAMLYPVRGVYVASDRDWEPETGRGNLPTWDAVFLSITPEAYRFLDSLPESPCERFLDLCAGAGAAGLLAAGHAHSVWACDIAPRAVDYARWNARLNGIGHFHAAAGDLYEPVAGIQFDRIAAHPPFVPAAADSYVFRDAGPDGERVTRRIVEGLPSALAPGGQCYLTATLSDSGPTPVEQRLRALLGPAGNDLDIFVAVRRRFTCAEQLALTTADDLRAGLAAAQAAGVEAFLYATLVFQRRSSGRAVFTQRRELPRPTGPVLEWIVRWEALRREPGFDKILLEQPLTVSPHVRLLVNHSFQDGQWTPLAAKLTTHHPVPAEMACPPWLDQTLRLLDGRRPAREVFRTLREQGSIPATASDAEFVQLATTLLSAGLAQIPTHPLPPA
jgi:SAM-dependent methyltransferase